MQHALITISKGSLGTLKVVVVVVSCYFSFFCVTTTSEYHIFMLLQSRLKKVQSCLILLKICSRNKVCMTNNFPASKIPFARRKKKKMPKLSLWNGRKFAFLFYRQHNHFSNHFCCISLRPYCFILVMSIRRV